MGKIYRKKIIEIGNSMGIYIPREYQEKGYEKGLEVELISKGAGILIKPVNTYKSRVRSIIEKESELIPEFYTKEEGKQSLRYEDLKTERKGDKVVSFVRDHMKKKIFMYYLVLNEKKEIIQKVKGNYVSEIAMKDILGGKDPKYYIS